MEVAPHELAQLLKLAGVGVGPEPEVMSEPDMPGAEIEPEVSVMAIPSDDGAPVGGGCGAPEPEHDHDHGGRMRGIIDMLQGAGEEPIEVEESPPKDDYENASNEFTGHPVDVVDTYDQYSYEPAKNSGMQRRTNSYGDNPLREDELIKEYTEFKKMNLAEWEWSKPSTWFGGDDKKAPVNTKPIQKRGTTSDAGGDSREIANKGKFVGQGFGGPKGNTFTKTGDPNEIHTMPGQQQTVRDQNALSNAPDKNELRREYPATTQTATAGKGLDKNLGKRSFMDPSSAIWKKNMAARPGDTSKTWPGTTNVAPGNAVTSVDDSRSTARLGPTAAEIKTYNDPRRTASQGPTADEIKMHRTKRGPETFRGNDIDTMKHAERWRGHPEADIPRTTVANPDDDQTVGQQVTLTPDQRKAAIDRAQPYSRQNDWAPDYYANQGNNYVTDPAIAPPVDTSADNDDEDEYDSSQDDNSSAIAGAAVEPDEMGFLQNNPQPGDDQSVAPRNPVEPGTDEWLKNNPQPGDDQSAISVKQGGTNAGTLGPTAGGTDFNTTPNLASLNPDELNLDNKNETPPTELVSPEKGTRINDFAQQLGYPSIQAFMKAQPKGSIGRIKSGPNLGNYFVKPGRKYTPFGESVGLSRNINRLKFLAGI